ncbi:hypothetical protein [Streptomyces griseus]|uniref:hypothetical protein n=1 Tax=Streptomyces griseus TaxID=1911 RepID=UPI0033B50D8E
MTTALDRARAALDQPPPDPVPGQTELPLPMPPPAPHTATWSPDARHLTHHP